MKKGQHYTEMIVVEAYEPCDCHLVILCRELDARWWHYWFIQQPTRVNFGSIVVWYPYSNALFHRYNPKLSYTIRADPVPPEIKDKWIKDFPFTI